MRPSRYRRSNTARFVTRSSFALWCVVLSATLVAGTLLSVFELDGNVADDNPASPDWAELFIVDVPPDGTVTGTVHPLPGDGVVAGFERDELAISGLDKVDCSVFGRGNKNGDAISTWEFKSGSVPPKDDLSVVMAYLRHDGSGGLELFVALERYAENGDSHVDFEINQGNIGLAVDEPGTDCPGNGHFVGDRVLNDLLVAVDFERGGAIGLVRIYRYLNATDLELLVEESVETTSLFCNSATSAGEVQIPAATICVINNATPIDGGPWANYNRSDNKFPVQTLPPNAFTELGIRLSDLPGSVGTQSCIRSINVKTRSSQSITSELKDFKLIQFNTCSTIAGRKFEVEADGACGTDPRPLGNWEIRLLDTDGDLVTTDGDGTALANPTCTGADGSYAFANLPNGANYVVCEVIPDRATGTGAENFDWTACEPEDGANGAVVAASACGAGTAGHEFCHPAMMLSADATGVDFSNQRDVITCDLTATKFCDVDGDAAMEAPDDVALDGFCLCVTRLVDGQPDDSTKSCGVTTAGSIVRTLQTGATYRVEEDITGIACGSGDQSDGWIPTIASTDIYLNPDTPDTCSVSIGNKSRPSITCPSDKSFECSAIGDFGVATASNDCGDVSVSTADDVVTGCGQSQTITRTHTATTSAGEVVQCEQTIEIVDTTPPVITCPKDLVFECDDVGDFGTATATDNCGEVTISDPVETRVAGQCPKEETITRTFTATDACGLTAECTQTIEVVDTTAPVVTCPPDLTVECDDIPEFGEPTVEDNCDPDPLVTLVVTEIPGDCTQDGDGSAAGITPPPKLTIVREFTATDGETTATVAAESCNNSASCIQVIEVLDTTPPTITCPPDMTFDCDNIGDFGVATATDGCGAVTIGDPAVVETPGCGESKTITRTFTATDECGLQISCQQTIEIVDTSPPMITCPDDLVFECDAVGDFGTPTATDNCGPVTISDPIETRVPGLCPKEETITRTFTATDGCGLTDDCTQTVQVVDTTAPVVTCPPDLTVECGNIPPLGEPTIEDNCDPDPLVTVTVIEVPGDCTQEPGGGGVAGITPPPKLTIYREFTVTESTTAASVAASSCNNTATCTQIIEVLDTLPPTIDACPTDVTISCREPYVFTIPTTDGGCDGALIVDCMFMDTADPDRFVAVQLPSGDFELTVTEPTTVTVACTATDECLNQSSACIFDVTGGCNQACSPGFWRNNLDAWCVTPFNPRQDYCSAGAATGFLEAFELGGCPLAPADSSYRNDLTLLEAVSTSGGSDQAFFHGSAALISSYAVAFPVESATVRALMRDACTGSTDYDGQAVSWQRAFDIFVAWNAAEFDGGCPIAHSVLVNPMKKSARQLGR